MTWRSDIARLPTDADRLDYCITELECRDAHEGRVMSALRAQAGLTPAEARIAERLIRSYRHIVTRDMLIHALQPQDDIDERMSLYGAISRLRRKLRSAPVEIIKVQHEGYCMTGPDEPLAAILNSTRKD